MIKKIRTMTTYDLLIYPDLLYGIKKISFVLVILVDSHDADSHERFPEQVYSSTDECLTLCIFSV